jgi:SAM-dependent methyltransferase
MRSIRSHEYGNVLNRAVAILRTEGVPSLWFKTLGELGYRRALLRECVLDEDLPEVTPRIPLTIELLANDQVEEYNAARRPADCTAAARRLAAGDRCFVARHEGRIVGTRWAATGTAWSAYLSRRLALAVDEVYMYDGFTAPDLRGRRIYSALACEMFRYYRRAGSRRALILVVPERGLEHVPPGYRTIGTLGYVKLGKWRYNFCRMQPGLRAPGEHADSSPAVWDRSLERLIARGHYLNPFLAELKRRSYLELINHWGGVPPEGRILKTDAFEEAMGPDALLTGLVAADRMAIGIDLSAFAIQQAQRRDGQRRARYVLADVRTLPFAAGSFALIISPSTLDHFRDPADLGGSLRELARVLAPDGRLIITLDNRQNIFDPLLRLANRLGWVPYQLGRSYTVDELRAELVKAGFDVRATTAIVHHPRLTAVAAAALERRLGWAAFTRAVQKTFLAAQRLQATRWRYLSGCFVAALAVPGPGTVAHASEPDGATMRNQRQGFGTTARKP